MKRPLVTISIVTFNSRRYLESCFAAIRALEYDPIEVVVLDNASTDGTVEWLERQTDIRFLRNSCNAGFAGGQNQAIRSAKGEWILTLNPDVRLDPGFLLRLVDAARPDPFVGSACGKLLRAAHDLAPLPSRRIDSAGMYITPGMRHLDRGWNEPDRGQYDQPEHVFGACAAAALYRREMIERISFPDGFFDPGFFAYREDADIAWRAQLSGWKCLYEPAAEALHVRGLKPDNRRNHPSVLRMHSVKNRFLMRINNITPGVYRRTWAAATWRDLVVLGGCLLSEPASLAAFPRLAASLGRALEHRRINMSRRAASDEDLAAWFNNSPVTRPAPVPAASNVLAFR